MLTIAIENHWLTHGERNPLEEEAEVKIGFAVTLVDEEIHDQKLTWDCDHPEELNA